MKTKQLKKVINEEVRKMLEISMTRKFAKSAEALQKVQLEQQKLRKAFVAEKNPKKKEALKQELFRIHKVVQKVELDFNRALINEPVGELEETDVRKAHGDKRLQNPKTGNKIKLRTALKAKKGSKVYQTARTIYNNLKDE